MALENEQELVAAMEELRQQMNGLGTEAAKADNALGKFGKSATTVGKEIGGVATQLAQGNYAFKSLSGVIDLTTKAVGGLLNVIPGVGGALKELAGAAGDAAKFVLQQFDDLAKNYQSLGESSAIATDGIDGLQRQFRQMGLMTLPAFTRAVNQNTTGFTALSGSVARGAEEFSNLAGALTQGETADRFLKIGMSLDGIGESAGKYVAAFARYGLIQGKTFDQLTASTQQYLEEVDQIARITGNTRKQQEEEQQKTLANVRFRAKIEQMRNEGQTEQAAELEKYVNGLTGPMADAARATLTGIPLTEEAAMANLMMGNALSENAIAIQNGRKATEALARTQQAAEQGVKQFSGIMQYTGDIAGGTAVQMFDMTQIARRQNEIMQKEGVTAEEAAKRAQEELMAQKGATQGFTNAQQSVAGSAKDLQNLSFTLVKNVIPAVDAFASGLKKVTGFIDSKFGGTPSATPVSMGGATSQSQKEFMDTMYKSLLDEAKKQGVKNPEIIARLGTAQSALETGYGRRLAGGNNYFGIKARPGEGGPAMATQEYINGQMVTVNDRFRRYGSMQESAADYVKFLKENKRYQGVLGANTLDEAITAQGRTGYATDPRYASKLSDISAKFFGDSSSGTTSTQQELASENQVQISLLSRLNDALDRLNQTAMTQVDVSRKIYQAAN